MSKLAWMANCRACRNAPGVRVFAGAKCPVVGIGPRKGKHISPAWVEKRYHRDWVCPNRVATRHTEGGQVGGRRAVGEGGRIRDG